MFPLLRSTYPPLIGFFGSLGLTFLSSLTDLVYLTFLLFLVAAIFIVDIKGRVNDYLYLRYKTQSYFTTKVLDRYGRSWCGRTVVTGTHPPAKVYFHAKGYRWYHILPDNSFTLKSPFLRCSFWYNLFDGHRR